MEVFPALSRPNSKIRTAKEAKPAIELKTLQETQQTNEEQPRKANGKKQRKKRPLAYHQCRTFLFS
jgi:hypothetical protein